MKEDLLQFVWQQKMLCNKKLIGTKNESIEIIKPGMLNTNSGPDFFNARIKINETIWAGNVEIHINGNDWIKHKHHLDDAYKNVILHVVYENDGGLQMPTLELKNYISDSLLKTYLQLQQTATKIPCEKIFTAPDTFTTEQYLHRLAIERLEQKCEKAEAELMAYNQSWEKLFYVHLARYFGMKINAAPFEQLAKNLPIAILAKHKYQKSQIYALILGVAGFLSNNNSTEILPIKKEFMALQKKYNLATINPSQWKFAKTRPVNFPTVRLLQFAELVFQSTHLFSKIMEEKQLSTVVNWLSVMPQQENYYTKLNQAGLPKSLKPGKAFLEQLVINAIAPIKFIYGKHQLNESYCETAVTWLEQCANEKIGLVGFWKNMGVISKSAIHSQGILQLNQQYCMAKKCLHCNFGQNFLMQNV